MVIFYRIKAVPVPVIVKLSVALYTRVTEEIGKCLLNERNNE